MIATTGMETTTVTDSPTHLRLVPYRPPADPICKSAHPTKPEHLCHRPAGHDGDHAAYTFHLTSPETWPTNRR